MPSTYSPLLRFEEIGSGEQSGLWGDTTNKNLGELVEQAIAGVTTVSLSGTSDVTLSTLDGALDQSRSAVLKFIGAPSGPINIIIPTSQKLYVVRNECGQVIRVKTLAQPQIDAVVLKDDEASLVFCDGSVALRGIQTEGVGTLTVPGGGTGATTFTGGFIKSPGGTGNLFGAALVNLTAEVSGQLPTANGGTGVSATNYCNLTTNVNGILPVVSGGTGASNIATARTNLGLGTVSVIDTNGSTTQFLRGDGSFATPPTSGGTVTSVATGTGLTGGPITGSGTIALANTAVAPGLYTNATVTVDAQGRIIAAASGTSASGTVTSVSGTGTASGLTLSGTVTTSGSITLSGTVNSLAVGNYSINILGTATNATNVAATTSNTDSNFKIPFLNTTASTTGNYGLLQDSQTEFLYNPSAGKCITDSFSSTTLDLVTSGLNGFNLQSDGNLVLGHRLTNPSGFFNSYFFNNVLAGNIAGATGGTTVAFNTTSDYRLKEDVKPMVGALNRINSLKPVTYTWKANQYKSEGFIAHEVQEFFPDAVTGEKDGVNPDGSIKAQGIDTSLLVAALVASVQELSAKIDAQASKITGLEEQVLNLGTN